MSTEAGTNSWTRCLPISSKRSSDLDPTGPFGKSPPPKDSGLRQPANLISRLPGEHGPNIRLNGLFDNLELLRADLFPLERAQHGGAVAAEANTRADNGQCPHLSGRRGCRFSGKGGDGFGQHAPQRCKTPV